TGRAKSCHSPGERRHTPASLPRRSTGEPMRLIAASRAALWLYAIAIGFLLPAVSQALPGKPSDAGIRSNAILILDESNSSVLFSKDADVAFPIASITKLMTALVVLEAGLALDEPIKITTAERATDKGGPSRLPIDATLTRGELLRLALMSSENRAAHALGRSYPGGTHAI